MERIRERIISSIFIVFIVLTMIEVAPWEEVVRYRDGDKEQTVDFLSEMEEAILGKLSFKDSLIDVSGILLKSAGTRSYYNNTFGINVTKNGYNIGHYEYTTTDYEVEQLVNFKKYLDEKGIQLLYVSKPAKYIDDNLYQKEFGGGILFKSKYGFVFEKNR